MEVQDTLYNGNTIRTYTGQYVDVFNPDPNTFHLVDIAVGLAYENRWNNQNKFHYSVAQHSLLVADLVPDELQLHALFHDASDAYIGDLSRPIKKLCPEFQTIESTLMVNLASTFGFTWPKAQEVEDADKCVMRLEYLAMMVARNPQSLEHPFDADDAMWRWLERACKLLELNIDEIIRDTPLADASSPLLMPMNAVIPKRRRP